MKLRKQFSPTGCFPSLSYIVTVPDDMDAANEKLPLIVFLHGAAARGEDLDLLEEVVGMPLLFGETSTFNGVRAITLSPQCPSGAVWNHLVFPVKELIDHILEEYPIDRDRVSITGFSMGGFGTWDVICTYPKLFSAAAPICGGGLSWRAGALKTLPIRVFHGDADTVVPLSYSEQMVDAVKKIGGNISLTVYPGVDHSSWIPAYRTSDVIEWLVLQKRGE